MSKAPGRCDIVIRHGTLVDGTGGPLRTADVAISGDRIAAVGDLGAVAAEREIDARGRGRSRPASSTSTPTTIARFSPTPTWRSRRVRG